MNYWLLLIPVLSAILGWIGAWTGNKILLYKIIPSRQEQLAKEIGKIALGAFSFSDIEKKISDPANIKNLMPVVEAHVDDFLRNKLKTKMPVVGMFIGDKTINSLKEVFLKEIEELFPQVLKQFAGNLQNQINIEKLVANKITNVSPSQIEKSLAPALGYYCFVGAVTGFFIGLLNLLTFYLISK